MAGKLEWRLVIVFHLIGWEGKVSFFFFTPVTDQSKVLYNQNQSYYNSQSEERKLSQGAKVQKSKQAKSSKCNMNGWQGGMRFLGQSQSEVKQN